MVGYKGTIMDAVTEFGFIEALPKRKATRWSLFHQALSQALSLSRSSDGLFSVRMVSALLNVSRSRVYQLIETGDLELIEFAGHRYIPGASIHRYADSIQRERSDVGWLCIPRENTSK
jgi:hypothetical protein